MEAKDTVTSACALCSSAINQAEISFKAGYDKRESEFVYNPDYLDFQKGVEVGKLMGRLAGIKEVVEWLKTCQMPDKPSSEPYPGLVLVSKVQFEAKLKEWDIQSPSGVEAK